MDILIAGGGIAGLATGIALRQAGHAVQVLERSSGPPEVGAGLALWPNGERALASLGVADVPRTVVRRLELRTWHDRLLNVPPIDTFKSRYGYELTLVHRAELHAALLEHLGKKLVRFSNEVTGFQQQPGRVLISLSSGEILAADLLIGADGIRSAVRRHLLRDGEPRYSGATCWRGIADSESDEGKAYWTALGSMEKTQGDSYNWVGLGGEFGIFPLSGDRVYWFGVQNRPADETDSPSGRKKDVLGAFASWPGMVDSVIHATGDRAILRNDLYDRPPVRIWSRGRVALAGDAAHPMLPNVAQGASQALEDAVVLGQALVSHNLEEAFTVYEIRRVRTANRLMAQARQTARLVQSGNPVLASIRDQLAAHLPRTVLLRQLDSFMAGR